MLGKNLLVLACKNHSHRLVAFVAIAEKDREIIVFACLYVHSVVAIIEKSDACPTVKIIIMTYTLGMNAHICGIVGIEGTVCSEIDIAGRVTRTLECPGCSRSPSVTHSRIKLERTILYEFGIETSVGRITDVFEEDTYEFVTDFQSSFGSFLRKSIDIKTHSSAKGYGLQCSGCIHIVYFLNVTD